MDTSLNPCLCKDLYGYLMELCLGLSFSYLFSSVFGLVLSCYVVVWFGCGPQWRKNLYRENVGFLWEMLSVFLKPMFLF